MTSEPANSTFTVKTEVFSGPLDLLLSLIEKRKLYINDISLSQVTDDYVKYVQEHQHLHSIAGNTGFIVIASTLVLIKSRSLLPTLQLEPEEEANIQDLTDRLKLYKEIKELGVHIEEKFGSSFLYEPLNRIQETVFTPDESVTKETLSASLEAIFNTLPKFEKRPEVVIQKVVSLEEMIDRLHERITSNLNMSFRDFAGVGKEDKITVVVSFLALLELVKNGLVGVRQDNAFDDIRMETDSIGTPRY